MKYLVWVHVEPMDDEDRPVGQGSYHGPAYVTESPEIAAEIASIMLRLMGIHTSSDVGSILEGMEHSS